jgi:hypothetical protein
MTTRTSTHHFITFHAACRYYANQGESVQDVRDKIREGTIAVGAPLNLDPTQRLVMNREEGRYFLEEVTP